MKKKTIKRRPPHSNAIPSGVDPLLHRIYAARGATTATEFERELKHLLPFHTLLGIDTAVQQLANALQHQKKILIVGDFDADGATSTAVAIRALRLFGARYVDYLVPNRFAYGYGLTPELVEVAKTFSPDVIVTVDNGIANHAGVLAAKAAGITVIITDHHLPAETLPVADAIVNPNQPHDPFPSKHLAGVGVIFYVMLALRRYLSEKQWFIKNNLAEPKLSSLLDIVALGSIADVVPLDHNNRILIHQGLQRIRARQCVPGILALLTIAGREAAKISAADLGFAVAPRLNAAGRLEDMSLGIECLLTDDSETARITAERLNQLNEERRSIEQDMQQHALDILKKRDDMVPMQQASGICLYDKTWHAGVIGILASRIKDRFYRPVVIFAAANEHELKGSARSIPGIHIRDIFAEIAAHHPHVISKFGGHAMAAGLTIPASAFELFSKLFNECVARYLTEEIRENYLWSDGELTTPELSLQIADKIQQAGPWGQGFPEPLFDGIFQMMDQRIVGNKHLKLVLAKDQQLFDAIAFNINLDDWPNYRCQQVAIAYRLDVNEYRGKRQLQLIVEQLEGMASSAEN